jgi:DeoR family fructose operon transcriptional repressor
MSGFVPDRTLCVIQQTDEHKMRKKPRQAKILAMINAEGEQSIHRLTETLGVNAMTIRRDLASLASQGRLLRTHGGAMPVNRVAFEFEFLNRMRQNEPAKQAIGAAAAKLVRDDCTVMLDSGTTTLALAGNLKTRKGISVITTSLPIASTLQYSDEIQVLILGGFLQRNAPDLGGALTESNLENLHADMAFLGAEGIDERGGIYSASLDVARLLSKMAAAAQQVYIVADHSKLGRTALTRYGNLCHWNGIITDSGADAGFVAKLRKAGAQVIIAGDTSPGQPDGPLDGASLKSPESRPSLQPLSPALSKNGQFD